MVGLDRLCQLVLSPIWLLTNKSDDVICEIIELHINVN